MICGNQLAANRGSDEYCKGNDKIEEAQSDPNLPDVRQMCHQSRHDADDTARRKSEDKRKHHCRSRPRTWQPQCQRDDSGEGGHAKKGGEPPPFICNPAGEDSSHRTGGVQDADKILSEVRWYAPGFTRQDDEGERNKETEEEEEHGQAESGELELCKWADKIHDPHWARIRWNSRSNGQVGHQHETEDEEGTSAHRPGISNLFDQSFHDDWEYHSPERGTGSNNTDSQCSSFEEPTGDLVQFVSPIQRPRVDVYLQRSWWGKKSYWLPWHCTNLG